LNYGPATAHCCSNERSSSSGVSEDFRAAVKSWMRRKAAAFAISGSSLALNRKPRDLVSHSSLVSILGGIHRIFIDMYYCGAPFKGCP